jgi:hypothetical protein
MGCRIDRERDRCHGELLRDRTTGTAVPSATMGVMGIREPRGPARSFRKGLPMFLLLPFLVRPIRRLIQRYRARNTSPTP